MLHCFSFERWSGRQSGSTTVSLRGVCWIPVGSPASVGWSDPNGTEKSTASTRNTLGKAPRATGSETVALDVVSTNVCSTSVRITYEERRGSPEHCEFERFELARASRRISLVRSLVWSTCLPARPTMQTEGVLLRLDRSRVCCISTDRLTSSKLLEWGNYTKALKRQVISPVWGLIVTRRELAASNLWYIVKENAFSKLFRRHCKFRTFAD